MNNELENTDQSEGNEPDRDLIPNTNGVMIRRNSDGSLSFTATKDEAERLAPALCEITTFLGAWT